MNIPILVIYFNRPELFKHQLKALAVIKPNAIFFSADGPRVNNLNDRVSIDKCNQLITEFIDWDCTTYFNASDTNLGCNYSVPSAINWFFEFVDFGIILEDDCLIDQNFCNFAAAMNNRFKDSSQIMNISASTFLSSPLPDKDYFFSRVPFNWGWATWRRAWKRYEDFRVSTPKYNSLIEKISKLELSKSERTFWLKFAKGVGVGKYKTWDAKWMFTIMESNGFSITPSINLSQNIGYGEDATTTKFMEVGIHNKKINKLQPVIKHPLNIAIDPIYEYMLYEKRYKPNFISYVKHFLIKFLNFISYIRLTLKKISDKFVH
jgi:hypothetical protein